MASGSSGPPSDLERMEGMRSQQEYVLRTVEERAIRFVQLWFTDVLGTPKTFNITPAELENALEEGMTFDGSAIDGFSRVQESDVLARPDAKTFQLLPWHGRRRARWPACSATSSTSTARPSRAAPPRAAAHPRPGPRPGYTFFAAPEIEYFYFADADPAQPPETLDSGSYFDLTAADASSDLRRRTVLTLEEMGIPVEHAQHEDAPSQHEIDLRYTDALTMADTVMTVRLVVKEMAAPRGRARQLHAQAAGRGPGLGHAHPPVAVRGEHQRLLRPRRPLRALARWPSGSSPACSRHAREITAVTNQWVNSYKRLVLGYEAPIHVRWARNNRSALVRVPVVKRGKPESTRVEYRAPDSACNPYLAFAVILAAGLTGIEEGYELPPEADANLFDLTAEELAAKGIGSLPEQPQRGRRRDGALRARWPRPWASTSSSGSSATSGPSGPRTRPTSRQFELDRYLPVL